MKFTYIPEDMHLRIPETATSADTDTKHLPAVLAGCAQSAEFVPFLRLPCFHYQIALSHCRIPILPASILLKSTKITSLAVPFDV